MANWIGGMTYVGVTTDLVRRAHEHRTGAKPGFTSRYNLTRLVYFEEHASVLAAIQREKNLKAWPRAWKVALIEKPIPTGATSGPTSSEPTPTNNTPPLTPRHCRT